MQPSIYVYVSSVCIFICECRVKRQTFAEKNIKVKRKNNETNHQNIRKITKNEMCILRT